MIKNKKKINHNTFILVQTSVCLSKNKILYDTIDRRLDVFKLLN